MSKVSRCAVYAASALRPAIKVAEHGARPWHGDLIRSYSIVHLDFTLHFVQHLMLEFYPSITAEQFAEGCQSLERRCHDNLDGTTWLSVSWTGRELQIKERRQYQPNLSVSKSLEERKRDSTSDSAAVESTIVDLDEDDATVSMTNGTDVSSPDLPRRLIDRKPETALSTSLSPSHYHRRGLYQSSGSMLQDWRR